MKILFKFILCLLWVFIYWPVMLFLMILYVVIGFMWRFRVSDVSDIITAEHFWITLNSTDFNYSWTDTLEYYANPLDFLLGRVRTRRRVLQIESANGKESSDNRAQS
jgi:hypothetical protein